MKCKKDYLFLFLFLFYFYFIKKNKKYEKTLFSHFSNIIRFTSRKY
jgi:hypothetical protein